MLLRMQCPWVPQDQGWVSMWNLSDCWSNRHTWIIFSLKQKFVQCKQEIERLEGARRDLMLTILEQKQQQISVICTTSHMNIPTFADFHPSEPGEVRVSCQLLQDQGSEADWPATLGYGLLHPHLLIVLRQRYCIIQVYEAGFPQREKWIQIFAILPNCQSLCSSGDLTSEPLAVDIWCPG